MGTEFFFQLIFAQFPLIMWLFRGVEIEGERALWRKAKFASCLQKNFIVLKWIGVVVVVGFVRAPVSIQIKHDTKCPLWNILIYPKLIFYK